MATPRLRLGQLLVDARLITPEDLEEVLAVQKADGRRLGTLLVERGLINETQLTQILSHQLSIPWVSLLHIEFSRQLLNLVPHDVAERFCLVPIYVRHVRNQGETLYVAMEDPTNEEGLTACADHSGLPVRSMIAPPQDIRSAIRVYYGVGARPPSQPAPASAAMEEMAPPPRAPPPPSDLVPPPTEPAPTVPAAEAPPVAAAAAEASELGDEGARAPVERTETPSSRRTEAEAPDIEAVEIELPRPSAAAAQAEPDEVADQASPSERPVTTIPQPRGRTPRMVSLTLLDGTTISLPAKTRRGAPAEPEPEAPPPEPDADAAQGLTARDLVAALRAVSQGADPSEILEDHRWESMFAALLSLLLRKHLIADWEFVDELKKMR